jgi:hypothetical protein
VGIRLSKQSLARASELLGVDRPQAREYLRRVQILVGEQISYSQIVAVLEAVPVADRSDAAQVANLVRERGQIVS